MLLAMALAVTFSFVIASNDTLKGQITEVQSKRMEQMVQEGRITQEQVDRQQEAMKNMGTLFAVFGSIGAIVILCLLYFGGTFVLWLVGKFALKAAHGYSTYLAMYGLASWIAVLGSVVSILMIVGLGSMYATPSLALAVYPDYDPLNQIHFLYSKLELFSLWITVVIGIGLSKLTDKPIGVGIGYSFGMLILITLISYFFSFGM
jgi:ABC-type multidrug transport system fused ATPase/permease subunit